MFNKEISIFFKNQNKDGISDKINKLYQEFKLSDSQINEINENINKILNAIIENFKR